MDTSNLISQLQRQTELALQLVDLLTDEQTALISLQSERLIELAVAKEALVVSMDTGLHEILRACEANGFPATLDGLHAWLASSSAQTTDNAENTSHLLITYAEALAQSQRLNHVNACLVSEQLNSLQTRIQMLCSGRQDRDMTTYGPSGNLNSSGSTGLPCVVAS